MVAISSRRCRATLPTRVIDAQSPLWEPFPGDLLAFCPVTAACAAILDGAVPPHTISWSDHLALRPRQLASTSQWGDSLNRNDL